MKKRNYIDEILEKKNRNHKRGSRMELFTRRVYPLVEGFRVIKKQDASVTWRKEWLKYSAIGYIACIEGYFRLLIADLINEGEPYLSRISELRGIKFNAETVVAIHKKKVTIGEYISHLLPLNGVSDIDAHLTALIDEAYLKLFMTTPFSEYNEAPMSEVRPEIIGNVEKLFQLRHLHAHELATKERFPIGKIEELIAAGAVFVYRTEEIISEGYMKHA